MIPERYKNKGFTEVGAKRKSTLAGKKWMVLAKKGDSYKIVHGGDSSMQDYSQHKDKQRKENFWNRMGHTNDVFSARYWHKKFGTWQKGGTISELGYQDNSPYKNNKFIDINSPNKLIDMSNTGIPLFAKDNNGYSKILQPYSGMHKFTGTKIKETPIYQNGGTPRKVTEVPNGYTAITNRPNYYQKQILSNNIIKQNGPKMSEKNWTKYLINKKNSNDIVYIDPQIQPIKAFDGEIMYNPTGQAVGMYKFNTRQTNDNTQTGQSNLSDNVMYMDLDNYGRPKGDTLNIPNNVYSNEITNGRNTLTNPTLLNAYRKQLPSTAKLQRGGILGDFPLQGVTTQIGRAHV